MAAPRSPNYPAGSLADALAHIRKVWSNDGRNKLAPEVIAKHLGYSSMNGAAQVTLSVLKKYGLLAGGVDKLWVSDIAVTLLEGDPHSQSYRSAMRAAALQPPLFKELLEDFPDSIPSGEALRFHLIKKGFNAEAATRSARTYRETMELLAAVETSLSATLTEPFEPADGGFTEQTTLPSRSAVSSSQAKPVNPSIGVHMIPASLPGFKQDVFSLVEGDAVLQWPGSLSLESYEDLRDWLQLVLRKVARSVRKVSEAD